VFGCRLSLVILCDTDFGIIPVAELLLLLLIIIIIIIIIIMQFGIEYLHEMLFSNCQFHKNKFSKSHTWGRRWLTVLQAQRSLVRFPMTSLGFFTHLFLPTALRLWGRLILAPEMGTMSISWW
jgi:hypothetical protein